MGPQILIIKAIIFIRRMIPHLVSLIKRLGWFKVSVATLAVIIVGASVSTFISGSDAQTYAPTTTRSVILKSVAELSSETAPLSVVGQVTSKSEASVRAEKSGQVIGVYKELGDAVSAGAIVAEIENTGERAAVLQAEGGVDAAQANLSKVTGGARSEQRSILESNRSSASASLDAAKADAVNALLSAYATVDNTVHGTDKMFTNPLTDSPLFNLISSDSQLTMKITSARPTLNQYLKRQAFVSDTLSKSSDLVSEIETTVEEARIMRAFLDLMVSDLNKGIPTTAVSANNIATYLSETIAARTTLTNALSALGGATQGIASAKSALEVANKNLEQGVSGGQVEDVAVAKASLKQAQGGLAVSRANLEKTIIRAPISGTINSFSLKRGDYVQMASHVLTIANNGSLEVVSYVSENDAREIEVGQKAEIELAHGVITRIAPALDPITKKIEVRIGVDKSEDLINGQSVLVSIVRTRLKTTGTARITIPVAALKVESDRVLVFTVKDKMLVAHEVILGTLLGERVVVSSGLSDEMIIVTDARGLREREIVDVQ